MSTPNQNITFLLELIWKQHGKYCLRFQNFGWYATNVIFGYQVSKFELGWMIFEISGWLRYAFSATLQIHFNLKIMPNCTKNVHLSNSELSNSLYKCKNVVKDIGIFQRQKMCIFQQMIVDVLNHSDGNCV